MSLPASDQLTVPRMIGPFRVVRQLGLGSTSTVYLGERVDSFSQRVAIKLFHETQPMAALESEHRLLASLDHAHIVRLLDQGAHENGRRYMVMEFVDGVPIDRYCEARQLSNDERIQLLIKVLSAVSYAQHHLVVHADLKPSNILVDTVGAPKLLDFGIAYKSAAVADPKKLDSETIATTSTYTPAFASPEQLAGEPVTAASDIYCVGLIARLVLQRDSRAEFKNDLALILDKATRPEPDLRYRSAQEFADDLRALLDHRPIHARMGNRTYRAGKWARRHRTAAAVTLIFLAVLSVSIVGVVVQTVRAIRQRQLATARLHDIVRLTDTLEGELYDSVHPLAQGDQASALLLQAATKSLDNVAVNSEDDSALMLEVAQQYGKLARIERTRNGGDQAAASNVAKGLLLLRRVSRSDRNYSAAQAGIADLTRLEAR